MKASARRARSFVVVAVVLAVVGGAVWLAEYESSGGLPAGASQWQRFLYDTSATGSLAFSTVIVSAGGVNSVTTAHGQIDFAGSNASETSVVRSPNVPAQWSEVSVIGGVAYTRPATDIAGGRRFRGAWTRVSDFEIAPFAPVSGSDRAQVPVGGETLTPLGVASVNGAPTTKYGMDPLAITCVGGSGAVSTRTIRSSVWVDGDGRIRRFEEVATISVGSFSSTVLSVSTFDSFGLNVSVASPSVALGAAAPAATGHAANALAGCLVTPG